MIGITEKTIRIEDYADTYSPSHGSECIFTGYVREENEGKRVKAIEYSAHPVLAEKAMQAICSEASRNWGKELEIKLIHRVGRLELGEISVYISVRAPHRKEAFAASRYIIDELKKRVSIWKKEYYENGESEWLEGFQLEA